MAICLPHVDLAGVAVGAFLQWPPRALESFGLLGLELNPPQFRGPPPQFRGPPPQFRGRQITFDLELYSAPPGLFLKTCRQTYSNKDKEKPPNPLLLRPLRPIDFSTLLCETLNRR